MADDLQLSDDEKQAILAHRRDNTPKRKGTGRYTDPETGVEFSFELTSEEAGRLVDRLGNLFSADPPKDDPKDKPAKPSAIKDYFGKKTAAS